MSDAQFQALLQQQSANKIGGDHLEVLGKKAAALWAEGRAPSLSEAVTTTVKTAGLSPEQVKRVVEFTNTAAYLQGFRKEGSPHRVIDFGKDGPADPSLILQDLNDGGGGTVFDRGTSDYHHPPPGHSKTASAWEEQALASLFSGPGLEYPEVNPLGDVIDLREKLGSAYQQTTAMLTDLEAGCSDLQEQLFHQVKQAALSGHSLSEIVVIWSDRAPTAEHVKVAFAGLMEPLIENGVFQDHAEFISSLQKTASVGMVNEQHPLVGSFVEYCEVLSKLAEVRGAQQELGEGYAELTRFLKEADSQGLLQHAGDLISAGAQRAGGAARWVGEKALGKGHSAVEPIGNMAEGAVKYVLPAVAANEVYRHTLKHNPTFAAVKHTVVGAVPGTEEYRQKELELQMAAQGYPMGGGY